MKAKQRNNGYKTSSFCILVQILLLGWSDRSCDTISYTWRKRAISSLSSGSQQSQWSGTLFVPAGLLALPDTDGKGFISPLSIQSRKWFLILIFTIQLYFITSSTRHYCQTKFGSKRNSEETTVTASFLNLCGFNLKEEMLRSWVHHWCSGLHSRTDKSVICSIQCV